MDGTRGMAGMVVAAFMVLAHHSGLSFDNAQI